jgi:hypothetical protein
MKPYLVQRLEYSPDAHDYAPAPGTSPVFVAAPSPKAAAVKACKYRQVHEGRAPVYLRVLALVDQSTLDNSPARRYWVELEAVVVNAWATL